MLSDVLWQDLIIKLVRILLCQVVIDLSLFWFNNICLLRVGHIGQTVFVVFGQIFRKEFFVFPGSFLLLHQSLCGRFMSGLVITIKFTHDFVELVHVKIVILLLTTCCLFEHTLLLCTWLRISFICKIIKLLLKCSNFSFIFCVLEFISCDLRLCGGVIGIYLLGNLSSFSLSHRSSRSFAWWFNFIRGLNLCGWSCCLRSFGRTFFPWTRLTVGCYCCFWYSCFTWACLLSRSSWTIVCHWVTFD